MHKGRIRWHLTVRLSEAHGWEALHIPRPLVPWHFPAANSSSKAAVTVGPVLPHVGHKVSADMDGMRIETG